MTAADFMTRKTTGVLPCRWRPLRLFLGLVPLLVIGTTLSRAAERMALGNSEATAHSGITDTGDSPADGSVRAIVRPFETAAISAEINARITYLPQREGDSFHKGDPLVEFDCRRTVAERDAAEAAMKDLSAAYESQKKLLEYKSAGTVTVEQALHQFERAEAELRVYQVRLESCRIVAPFDGVVSEKTAQVHEIAQPNQTLIKIINQKRVELVMMVPSAWLTHIGHLPFPVVIDETGETYQARFLQTTGIIDPVSQTARVIAELVEADAAVLPGMSGTARLLTAGAAR